jgi:hypothetical protein
MTEQFASYYHLLLPLNDYIHIVLTRWVFTSANRLIEEQVKLGTISPHHFTLNTVEGNVILSAIPVFFREIPHKKRSE